MTSEKDKIEITVMVNGKSVPLSSVSDETLSRIKRQELSAAEAEEEKKAPVFSVLSAKGSFGRLIVKMTPNVIRTMRGALARIDDRSMREGRYISFEPNGLFGTYDAGQTRREVSKYYSCAEVKPIF